MGRPSGRGRDLDPSSTRMTDTGRGPSRVHPGSLRHPLTTTGPHSTHRQHETTPTPSVRSPGVSPVRTTLGSPWTRRKPRNPVGRRTPRTWSQGLILSPRTPSSETSSDDEPNHFGLGECVGSPTLGITLLLLDMCTFDCPGSLGPATRRAVQATPESLSDSQGLEWDPRSTSRRVPRVPERD